MRGARMKTISMGPPGSVVSALEDDGVVLAAIGVALDVDVEHAEAALRRVGDVFREKDAAGAGSEYRLSTDELVEY